jgi:SAM-dependent methyltransferase
MPEPWLACGWSAEGQRARHLAVVEALEPEPGDRLLDWGCGTGELCELLDEDVEYVGYDSAPGMILRAGKTHPGRKFQTWEPTAVCDLVACVGCFNLSDRWSKARTWHTLRHLWDTTSCRALAASLYAGDDPNCLSYTGAEAATCGAQLAASVTVDAIRTNDLLLIVRR